MSLMCQKNSYLKEFTSAIKSCQRSIFEVNGQSIDGFDVVLEDTIFFPEGGGQPYDTGLLGDKAIIHVRRDGSQAVLFVAPGETPAGDGNPFEVGDEPLQKIDWTRRFDHMQQHSGQHLITAIALSHFNVKTTSWSLGLDISNIELDTPSVSNEMVEQIEKLVNEKIRENVPVNVSYRNKEDMVDVRMQMVIPEDQGDTLRVVSIEGLDKNPCCGTHVASLGHLQMIKLTGAQKGKKGKTLLYFLAGNRVLDYFGACLKREKQLAATLKCPSEEFTSMVDKMQKNIKRLQKNCLTSLRDLAKHEAERYLALSEKPKLFSIHRKESDYDFISCFVNTIGETACDGLILLSVADDCNVKDCPGQIMIVGPSELVAKSSAIAIDSFGAKGSVSKGKFRARVPDVSKLIKLEDKISKEVFS